MDRSKLGILAGFVVILIVVAGAILIARGGGDDDSSSSGVAISDTKPKIKVPDGPAPTTLQTKDITEGEGPEAKDGDKLSMQYVGALYSNGKEFDASWDRGQPFDFTLGGGMVIPGWDQGIVGMKAGGRRELIIPPDLGYGAQGSPPTIPGDSTLIFVVDLISINAPAETTGAAGAQ